MLTNRYSLRKRYRSTVNTHKGLFQYLWLPFGIASDPGIFQWTMETTLQGLHHVCVYFDDILITGPTEEEHLSTFEEVLKRLDKAGVRFKRNKCEFMLPLREYLRHRISKEGLEPTDGKVKALKDAPAPANVSQLKSFLGLLNYYGKFVSNLSTVLAPLHRLLHKSTPWSWGQEQQTAFDHVKELLTSDNVLTHYDQAKPVVALHHFVGSQATTIPLPGDKGNSYSRISPDTMLGTHPRCLQLLNPVLTRYRQCQCPCLQSSTS